MTTATLDLLSTTPKITVATLRLSSTTLRWSMTTVLYLFFSYPFATVLSLPLNRTVLVTGFDLNLPLDEFGAVDFNYLQNLDGTLFFPYYLKYAHAVAITIMHMP